ncbi:hypothetical protein D3C80_702420 [compost metagenome]
MQLHQAQRRLGIELDRGLRVRGVADNQQVHLEQDHRRLVHQHSCGEMFPGPGEIGVGARAGKAAGEGFDIGRVLVEEGALFVQVLEDTPVLQAIAAMLALMGVGQQLPGFTGEGEVLAEHDLFQAVKAIFVHLSLLTQCLRLAQGFKQVDLRRNVFDGFPVGQDQGRDGL